MGNIVEVKGIHKSYAKHVALQDVSMNIPEKSIFGLLGPNGAGKTTLIRIINQIIMADRGSILINGEKLAEKHIQLIGYLPEERGLYKKMKVGEQLIYFGMLRGLSKKDSAEKTKKWVKKFEIESWWNKNIEDLSKGMAQKVQFISTVLHDPKLIILDEPFSGFDPVNANLIKDEILELKEKGASIIFSTHRMESVEQLCDHIAMIHHSRKILDGSIKEIKSAYKANEYYVQYKGELNGMTAEYELIENEELGDDFRKSLIKAPNSITNPNEILRELISNVEVHSFTEKIPSINDIFIAKAKEKSYE
jgi:ABC-2 type transport system ATP-binding protein